jgi:UDP-N-acetylmuramoylalanine--D-glutamate ligase
MNIALVGYGLEGQSSLKYFSKDDNQITICDQKEDITILEGVEIQLGPNYLDNLDRFDLIVRSAGIPPQLILEKNPNVASKLTTQLNEFLRVCPSKNIIGVTGTKGKGTTSSLIKEMLSASGREVLLGGNIGIAMLEMLPHINEDTYVVLELSSFQLSDLKETSPPIAICLMIDMEHLDWHGSEEAYIAAKANLFSHQTENSTAIYFKDNELSERIVNHSPGTKIPYFSSPGAYVQDNKIVINDQVICETKYLKLLGEHNWQNLCAALTVVWQVTQDVDSLRSAVLNFSGLPHRIEFVREFAGVKYYNDSYASQLKATEAAIITIKEPKVMILGGFDRMLELNSFSQFIKVHEQEFRKLLLIGVSAKRLADSLESAGFKNFILKNDLKTMIEIVDKARSLANEGDAIVLSPGFASFDMFKNFEDRGLLFKEVVNAL